MSERRLIGAALGVALLALWCAGLALWFTPAPSKRPNLSAYVTKAQLGIGSAALAQQANAAMRAYVQQFGLVPLQTSILSERLDGDRGTIVVRETWKAPGHKPVAADFTLIFHRTVWALGQLNPGAPAGMSQ